MRGVGDCVIMLSDVPFRPCFFFSRSLSEVSKKRATCHHESLTDPPQKNRYGILPIPPSSTSPSLPSYQSVSADRVFFPILLSLHSILYDGVPHAKGKKKRKKNYKKPKYSRWQKEVTKIKELYHSDSDNCGGLLVTFFGI